MSAATLDKAPAAVAAAEVEPGALRWAVLAKAGVTRISNVLHDVIGAHTVGNRASALIGDSQGLLYLLEAVPATDPTIYKENDGIHVVSILRAARDQLELAKSLHEGGMPLSGAESDAIAAAAAMLHELMEAVEPAPGGMERLEAFASFQPVLAAREPVRPQVLAEDEAEGMRDLAFDANLEISMLALGMKRLLNINRMTEDAMYFGMLSRIEHLCNIIFHAAKLYPDDPSEWDDQDLKILRQKFEGVAL